MKWAKNTMCEMDQESLMGDMTVARMQQEFARDPHRVPLVHNKVGLRPPYLLVSSANPTYKIPQCVWTCSWFVRMLRRDRLLVAWAGLEGFPVSSFGLL